MAGVIPSPDLLLTNVTLTTIKPLQKTAHVESIDPTVIDLTFADLYVPTLFTYRLADNSDAMYSELINRLKESLQKALIPFFPFAGRWIAVPPGTNGRKLLCYDEGVPFIEAYVDKDLDSIVHASVEFQAVPELLGYGVLGMDMALLKQQMPGGGLSPIFVQVTRFKCGGVVLAVTFSHMHTDAKGFFNFMTAWSDLSRTNETGVKVDHNRAVADIPSLRNIGLKQDMIDTTTHGDDAQESTMRPWAMKAFEVSPSAITSIKQEAKDNKRGPGFVSTADCIVAHLWKSLTRLPSSMLGGKEPAITMAVEGRSLFYDTPLPDSYSGNVIAPMVSPKIPMKELREMPRASFAGKVREQLQSTGREEWYDSERIKEILEVFSSGTCVVMATTSWLKFPLYEMDFGIGKPIFASRVSNLWSYSRPPVYIGAVSIGPPIPSSSCSVATLSVFSTPDVLQALESDPHFLSLFLQR